MQDKRVIFMGTPEFSCPVLKKLIENTNVVCVVSKKDAMIGRKKILSPSPVKELSLLNNIPVITPDKMMDAIDEILSYKPDIIITCAFGKIVPKTLLDNPEFGCINVHASLLPKYRGASPIHKCIMDGEDETGISIMYMDESLDTGDIITSKSIKIEESDNLDSLSNKLSILGADLLIETLPSIFAKTNKRTKQLDEDATYVSTIKKEDEVLTFNKSRREVFNHIRSLSTSPGVHIILDGEIIKVYESRIGEEKKYDEVGIIKTIGKDFIGISCNDGIIEITKIKRAGKKEMSTKDFLNGVKKETLLGKKVG